MTEIRELADGDVEPLIALWGECGLLRPWNDPHADIALARSSPTSAVLVAADGDTLAGGIMYGADGHRGWLYYLAVSPARRDAGIGRRLVREAERRLVAAGVPKVQLMVREENEAVQHFYRAIGYRREPRVVMSRWMNQ